MIYSGRDLQQIKQQAIGLFIQRLDLENERENLDEFLEQLGFEFTTKEENPAISFYTKNKTKILVMGALLGKKKDYLARAKKYDIREENLEFVDYDEAKRFNTETLRYSDKYSDIIVGPIPHKVTGLDGSSSFLSMVEKKPEEYPKVQRAVANQELKLSLKSFEDCLIKSRFVERFNS